MKINVEQKVYVGLGLLFALLLGIGLFADRTVAQLVNDSKWVENSLEVKRSVEELPALLNEIQTTKNRALSKRVEGNITTIRRLTVGNDRQQGQLDILEPLIAAEIASPNTSPELATEIRKNIALIRAEEDRIFEKRKEQSESAVAQTIIIVRAGALIGLIALVLTAYMIRIDVR